jgi:hypothetical protein
MANIPFVGVRIRSARPPSKLMTLPAVERRVASRVTVVWGLLVLNVLSFAPGVSILPIPTTVGKLITQSSLSVALLLALTVNPRVRVRPSIFLVLVSLLALEAVLTALGAQYPKGTGYRTFRYVEFIAVLWLISPHFGRSDMLIMRAHLRVMLWVVMSTAVGYIISPGSAMKGGRLQGVIWPIAATQVGHYAAVTIGIAVILWFCGLMTGRATLFTTIVSIAVLLLTHTRTALVGLLAGIIFGGVSLIVATPRVRRLFISVTAVATVAFLTASAQITSWMARGETSGQISNLSGRTNFWGPLLAYPRTKFQMIFGFGISNGSFNGLPVDSNWLISYQDQGLYGVVLCACILLFLLITALFKDRGVQRAIALFLTVYCLVASYTEDGITNVSTYMLDVAVAASLLATTREEA